VLVDADGRPIRIVRAIIEGIAFSVRHVLAVAEQQVGLRRSAFAARRWSALVPNICRIVRR
jgi:glycerol kinase